MAPVASCAHFFRYIKLLVHAFIAIFIMKRGPSEDSETTASTSPLLATSTVASEMQTDAPYNPGALSMNRTAQVSIHSPFLSSTLLSRLAGDVIVGCTVALGISPVLTVIDKAIVQKAAGTHGILQSSLNSMGHILKNPSTYFRSPMFIMMWGVYASTYCTANCLKTIVEQKDNINKHNQEEKNKKDEGISKFGVFALTTIVNSSATMLKDRYYASHFGTNVAASTKVPKITYFLWGMRDCMVIGSSFILPDIMCDVLTKNSDLERTTALRISQFACPVLTQFAVGPVQLLSLDIYNRPLPDKSWKEVVSERLKFQFKNYFSIVGARISRIAPAYGVGGIGNTYMRDQWRDLLLRKELRMN
mmetsp:Transcript_13568/g.25455  ORF Transcript_13568/g.25455 Transcript_13568/m.25455 type:complete len:361 (+) Transcript_13568:427-1509(+)